MKRLLSLIVTVFTVLALSSNAAAATRFWRVQMFEPEAETTTRQLRITYNVQSTDKTDDFEATLLQNGSGVASPQNINTPYGDSRFFSIDIPATGTYTYQVSVKNSNAGTETSESYTVEVVNAPEPTVTVVTVDGGQGAGGANFAAAQAGGAGAGQAAANGDAAQAGENGEVAGEGDDQAATDEAAANSAQEDGEVLGAESFGDRVGNTAPYVLIPAAIAVLGLMLYRARQAADQE